MTEGSKCTLGPMSSFDMLGPSSSLEKGDWIVGKIGKMDKSHQERLGSDWNLIL